MPDCGGGSEDRCLSPCKTCGVPEPSPLPEWCGAGLYTPVMSEDGHTIVAQSRRMCGLKEPHEWHQDRYDKNMRWQTRPPFTERTAVPTQAAVLAWVAARWPDHITPVWRAVKTGEEAGEVLGAVIKSSLGLKPVSAIEQETAQLIICAMALAESCGFDWRTAVADEWRVCATRTWTPSQGDTELGASPINTSAQQRPIPEARP